MTQLIVRILGASEILGKKPVEEIALYVPPAITRNKKIRHVKQHGERHLLLKIMRMLETRKYFGIPAHVKYIRRLVDKISENDADETGIRRSSMRKPFDKRPRKSPYCPCVTRGGKRQEGRMEQRRIVNVEVGQIRPCSPWPRLSALVLCPPSRSCEILRGRECYDPEAWGEGEGGGEIEEDQQEQTRDLEHDCTAHLTKGEGRKKIKREKRRKRGRDG